jgi:hypothetical protein
MGKMGLKQVLGLQFSLHHISLRVSERCVPGLALRIWLIVLSNGWTTNGEVVQDLFSSW